MDRRIVGSIFVAIAAFLWAARSVAASIYMSAMDSHGFDLYRTGLEYVGGGLTWWAVGALVVGAVYLALGEWRARAVRH
ncbi:MAG: hypothetical protein GX557_09835 [Chloroflexi bacterium]|nr:hypothetical protein [Chloroflexota bacterium]